MTIRPKQFARLGEFYLREAVLDTLLKARYEDKCIGVAEISKQSGIFREGKVRDMKGMNDAIVTGILMQLYREDKVSRCLQRPSGGRGWKLAEEEFKRRRDDTRD